MNLIKSFRLSLIPLIIFLFLVAPAPPTSSQRTKNVERQIDALIAKMSLEEKLGQLQQLDGEGNGDRKSVV